MPISCTSMGILPKACTASVWNSTLRRWQTLPISAMGWITPVSLLAIITETSTVWSVMAASTCSAVMSPSGPTNR